MKSIGTIAAGIALAACTPGGSERNEANGSEPAAAATPTTSSANATDYVAQVRTMAPKLRQATFLRAIRDAGQECQQVIAEQPAGGEQSDAVWSAVCEDHRGWMITIAPDGNAKVTGPIPPKATATSR